MKKIDPDTVVVFSDIETTGLDVTSDVMLEVAIVLTRGPAFEVFARHSILTLPEGMSAFEAQSKAREFVLNMHTESGLWPDLIESSASDRTLRYTPAVEGAAPNESDASLVAFLDEHVPGESKLLLGGNSQAFDRKFFEAFLPHFNSRLHYRNVDGTSIAYANSTAGAVLNSDHKTAVAHRGLGDLDMSIADVRLQRDSILEAVAGGPIKVTIDGDRVLLDAESEVTVGAAGVRLMAAADRLGAEVFFEEDGRSAQVLLGSVGVEEFIFALTDARLVVQTP